MHVRKKNNPVISTGVSRRLFFSRSRRANVSAHAAEKSLFDPNDMHPTTSKPAPNPTHFPNPSGNPE
jgi:hypothetical protein